MGFMLRLRLKIVNILREIIKISNNKFVLMESGIKRCENGDSFNTIKD